MATECMSFYDTLYGPVSFDEDIAPLIAAPVMQRLRHVRLSNIDSLGMPGIANLSRYEHVLGTGHLARNVGLYSCLDAYDRLALVAAALLHDWAITSFGHLVEEAFKYLGTGFDHEPRLYEIIANVDSAGEVGGIERQILYGRQTNLTAWAKKVAGTRANELLKDIALFVRGEGRFGGLISGKIDLDNIDNVYRMAYHMGLDIDRTRPLRLAKAMIAVDSSSREPVFAQGAEHEVEVWLTTRRNVYERLMPAQPDFACKLMVLYAAIEAYRSGEIDRTDWGLTDIQFVQRLSASKSPTVRETVARWMTGEVWDTTPLYWLSGDRPDYARLLTLSNELSASLGRSCLAYGIKDKRDRRLAVRFEDGSSHEFGSEAKQWLLGMGSPKRQAFSKAEVEEIFNFAADFFRTQIIGVAHVRGPGVRASTEQLRLL